MPDDNSPITDPVMPEDYGNSSASNPAPTNPFGSPDQPPSTPPAPAPVSPLTSHHDSGLPSSFSPTPAPADSSYTPEHSEPEPEPQPSSSDYSPRPSIEHQDTPTFHQAPSHSESQPQQTEHTPTHTDHHPSAPVTKEETPLPTHTPAKPPKKGPISSIVIGILTLLTLGSLTAAAFFYTQASTLRRQLQVLQTTLSQREVPGTLDAPDTMAPDTTPADTEAATPSAQPTTSSTLNSFTSLTDVIGAAKGHSPDAQLLMVTSDNIKDPTSAAYKYWFRMSPTTKSYFYIQVDSGGEPQLFTQATVNPDNNIPDLIPYYDQDALGIDSVAAADLAWKETVSAKTELSAVNTINAKFIRAQSSGSASDSLVNLWQLTYNLQNGQKIVVQINAATSEVLYSN